MQTPLNEERNKKRDREVATPTSGLSDQLGGKRHRLNPHSEEEIFEEIINNQRREGVDSHRTFPTGGTPSSSQRQELERQQSTEVSSFKPLGNENLHFKKKFKEVKVRNEPLRIQVYNKNLKIASTNQNRLMSTYNIKEGKMEMSLFKPKVQKPQITADYLQTNFEVMAKDFHPLDQIELHRQMGEIIYSTLTGKAMIAQRLENSLNNTIGQLQLERASSQANDNKIKSSEELVIGLGHNPNDVKSAEALIKKKDEDIAALRKQLKLPSFRHPQIAEIIQKKSEEELMDLILQLNEQLEETEQELERSLKSKQGESTS